MAFWKKVLSSFAPKTSDGTNNSQQQHEFINFRLWLLTLSSVCLAILFALIGSIFAIINFIMSPRGTLTGPVGLVIWNATSCKYAKDTKTLDAPQVVCVEHFSGLNFAAAATPVVAFPARHQWWLFNSRSTTDAIPCLITNEKARNLCIQQPTHNKPTISLDKLTRQISIQTTRFPLFDRNGCLASRVLSQAAYEFA